MLIRDERLRALTRYWLDIRHGRPVPIRRDFDPTRVPTVLPFIWMYDYEGEGRFRGRLAGDQVAMSLGRAIAGLELGDIFAPATLQGIRDRFRRCVERTQICHTTGMIETTDGHWVFGERLTMPLSRDGAAVDMLIGANVYDWGEAPREMPTEPEPITATFLTPEMLNAELKEV